MAENNNVVKRTSTMGRFDVVGEVVVDNKTFALNQVGKNNANWISHVFNPKVDAGNGQSMYMRFQCGYDKVKGKVIKKKSTTGTQLEIPFADRMNPNMISLVNENGFIKVGVSKKVEKNAETGKEYKVWETKNFLDGFDAIEFLQKMMPPASKQKVRITGSVKHSVFNDEVKRNYEIQNIYILTGNEDEGKEMQPKLAFTYNVLVTEGCLDFSKLDTDLIALINAQVSTYNKGNIEVLPVVLTVKSTDAEKTRRVATKYFNPPAGVVRRINVEGFFECGYIKGNVDENDLPQEAQDLIDDGLYSKEEVLKMYASKERVDRMICVRPVSKLTDGKPAIDMNDEEYTMEDLEGKTVEIAKEEEVVSEEDEANLLNELEGL